MRNVLSFVTLFEEKENDERKIIREREDVDDDDEDDGLLFYLKIFKAQMGRNPN